VSDLHYSHIAPADTDVVGHFHVSDDSAERQALELTLLHRVRAAIALDTDLARIFRTVVEQVSATFGYTLVSLYRLEETDLVLQHQVGYDAVIERVPLGKGVISRVVQTGQPVLIRDVSQDPAFLAAIPGIGSEISVPFFREGAVDGVFNVESQFDRPLDAQDFHIIAEVTGFLNLAVERSALFSAKRASEERLRIALEAAEMGAWEWYPSTGEVRWSEQMAGLYGLPPGTRNISAEQWLSLIHPEDRDAVARADRHFLRVGQDYELDFRIVLPGGAVRWLEGKGRVVERGPDGEALEVVGVTMDITGRKRFEEERMRLVQLETERAKDHEAQRVITDTLERMTAGFIALDRDWRFTYLNRRALDMLGREGLELGGRPIWNVFPELHSTDIERALRGVRESQRPGNIASFWPGPNRWIEIHVYPSGEGLSVYLQDVTERKHAEIEQQRIVERFRSLVQHSSDLILILGNNGVVRYASPAISRVLGLMPEDVIGSDNQFRVHPHDARRLKLAFVRVAKQPGVHPPVLLRFKHDNGSYRWIEVTATNLFNDPAIDGIVANCRDVTRRQEAEYILWFLAETSAVLGTSLDLETTLSSVTRLTVMNLADMCIADLVDESGAQEAYAVAHRDHEEERKLKRQRSMWPLDPRADYGPSLVLKTGKSLLYSAIDDDILSRWTGPSAGGLDFAELGMRSAVIVPMAARGEILGVLTVASTTPGKFSEVELGLLEELGRRAALAADNALLYRSARDAIEARDQFLSVAAHELRTPITAISGFSALLEREVTNRNDPERIHRFVLRLRDAGIRLNALVEDLLDVSHIRVGNLPLRIDSVDVSELVARVHRWYAEQDAFPAHRIRLRDMNGAFAISADEDRLEQVITNIFDNAIKYSPHGGVIDVSLEVAGDGMLLTVRDEGIGLEPGDLESIFRPFGRAPNAVAGNFVGLGIGLFICRNIVERHGGRIWATSAGIGSGATLHLWLPFDAAVEDAQADPESRIVAW
jgi:PAS domain S-box-containing protein